MAQAHCIKPVRIGAQRGFDIAQTLAPGQLRESHDAELLDASHATHTGVATMAIDDSDKAGPGHEFHELRE
jgi:hypothetical protein